MIELYQGDCLEILPKLPEKSVDLILCDLPYGTTQNKWDSILPLDTLWQEYKRLSRGPIVLTATQPFSSLLVISNLTDFKYEWIWQKSRVTGVLNAKRQPLRQHESVLVFSERVSTYNPQGLIMCDKLSSTGVSKKGSSDNYGTIKQTDSGKYRQTQTNYPRTVLNINSEGRTVHSTQKPVALMEYLIKTYTNAGDTVLDNTMGSGTTGVAAVKTNKNFIGIELDKEYFQIAQERINSVEPA